MRMKVLTPLKAATAVTAAEPDAESCAARRPQDARRVPRWLMALLLAGSALLLAGGCPQLGEDTLLARKARDQFEARRYEDAARNFATLQELYPDSAASENAAFMAASLYSFFLGEPQKARFHYEWLLEHFPKGEHADETRLNLVQLYEADRTTVHQAVQLLRQLLEDAENPADRANLQFRIATALLNARNLEEARLEYRNLLVNHPGSAEAAEAYYNIGFSYYLEKRNDVALAVFRKAVDDFPGTDVAARAQFFVADTLEEQGNLRGALQAFQGLRGKYANEAVLNKRIATLQGRLAKSAR